MVWMRYLSLVLVLATSLPAAPLAVKRFDTNHSTIGFRIPIAGGMSEVEGKFTDFAIDVAYDDQNLANSGVTAIIQATSIDTGIADRDKHLRSADFFDVAKYPEIKFVSSSIEKRPDGFVAHGTLTMHSVDPLFVGNDVDVEIRLITKLITIP
jgi:polyisoprenoid-binding protein YceI